MKLTPDDFPLAKANLSLKNKDNLPVIAKICNALSSELRLNVLKQIREKPQTVIELAKNNYVSISTMVFHVNTLEDAGLIQVTYVNGLRGPLRKCYANLEFFNLDLVSTNESEKEEKITYSMGVGMFIDSPRKDFDCSFCTKDKNYHTAWGNLFTRERFDAILLYSTSGYVTYAFPNDFALQQNCTEISISLEICSETFFYDNEFKSDITFWINEVELLTYTCPGDYGGRRGILNPDWWPDNSTQYGDLKTITVNDNGAYLDGILINSKVNLQSLNLKNSNRLLFKLGNKPNAKHVGGFNIFGNGFGDHKQDILLTATIKEKTE